MAEIELLGQIKAVLWGIFILLAVWMVLSSWQSR